MQFIKICNFQKGKAVSVVSILEITAFEYKFIESKASFCLDIKRYLHTFVDCI